MSTVSWRRQPHRIQNRPNVGLRRTVRPGTPPSHGGIALRFNVAIARALGVAFATPARYARAPVMAAGLVRHVYDANSPPRRPFNFELVSSIFAY